MAPGGYCGAACSAFRRWDWSYLFPFEKPGGGFLSAARIIFDLLCVRNGAAGHGRAGVISTLANHLWRAGHAARALRRGRDLRAFAGNCFGLITDKMGRCGSQSRSGKIRIIVRARDGPGLRGGCARGEQHFSGHYICCGQSRYSEGDKEVTSFHFQFNKVLLYAAPTSEFITPGFGESRKILFAGCSGPQKGKFLQVYMGMLSLRASPVVLRATNVAGFRRARCRTVTAQCLRQN
jgi:hypothetical protein